MYLYIETGRNGNQGKSFNSRKELNSKEFIMADRGYIANIRHVMKMKNRDLYMRNGNVITVGRMRFRYVREAIENCWKEL